MEPLFRTKGKEGDKATAVHVFPDHIMLIRLGSAGRGKNATNRAIPLSHVFSVSQRKTSIGVSTVSINTAGNPVEVACPHKDAGALCQAINGVLARQRTTQPVPMVSPQPVAATPVTPSAPRPGQPAPAALPLLPSLAAAPPPGPLTGPPEPMPCAVCNAPASYIQADRCAFCGQPATESDAGPLSPPPGWWIASDGRWYPPQGSF